MSCHRCLRMAVPVNLLVALCLMTSASARDLLQQGQTTADIEAGPQLPAVLTQVSPEAEEAIALQNAAKTGGFVSAVATNFTGRMQPGLDSGPRQPTMAAQAAQASAAAGVTGVGPGQGAQPRAFNVTGVVRPNQKAPPSVADVNAAAPTITFPSGAAVRPHLTLQPSALAAPAQLQPGAQSTGTGVPLTNPDLTTDPAASIVGTQTASASVDALPNRGANKLLGAAALDTGSKVAGTATHGGQGAGQASSGLSTSTLAQVNRITGTRGAAGVASGGLATGGDTDVISGNYISNVIGVRIATPLFGTGFNVCVDRWYSSFPKVGIVIPNVVAYLIPELVDTLKTISTTVVPLTNLPHGFRLDPTSDGFLIWLPTFQPSELDDFGLVYGIQIGQVIGFDFGYGIIQDTCAVTFVIV